MKAFEEQLRQLARKEAKRLLDEQHIPLQQGCNPIEVFIPKGSNRAYPLHWTDLDMLLNEMEYGSDREEWGDGEYDPEDACFLHLIRAQRRIWQRQLEDVLVDRMAKRLVDNLSETGFFNHVKTPTL